MAYNINTIYNLMRDIVRKQRGAMLTVDKAMQALDAGQLLKFEADFKSYAQTQTIHDSLRVFKVTNQSFYSAGNGEVIFETDYLHMLADLSVVWGSFFQPVNFVNPEEKAEAINSQLRAISTAEPIAEETSDGFILYPEYYYAGRYSYLRRPATPVLDVTYSGTDGRTVTYNPLTSVQLEWKDNYINSVIAYALQYIGINMDEQAVLQFSQLIGKQSEA